MDAGAERPWCARLGVIQSSDPLTIVFGIAALFCATAAWLYSASASARPVASRTTPDRPGSAPGLENVREILWIALVVRLAVSVLVGATGTEGYFAPDKWGYEKNGRAIVAAWTGTSHFSEIYGERLRLYDYINAVAFLGVGELAPWLIRSCNALVGAFAVRLAFDIAKDLFERRIAMRAAWLVALFPSMVLWSALNIRDAWAVFAVLLIVRSALRLRTRIGIGDVSLVLFGLTLLGALRGYMFLLIVAGVLLSYLGAIQGSALRNYVAGVIVTLVFLYLYTWLGFGRELLESASFETLSAQRRGLTLGADSAFYEDVDISSPGRAFAFLPIGMSFFLFAPFPWMLTNLRQLITLPEMLLWWTLAFRFLLPGIRIGLKAKPGQTLTVVSVALISVMAYGLVEGNVGTAYRHRAQVLPLLLILSAAGWDAYRARRTTGDLEAIPQPQQHASG